MKKVSIFIAIFFLIASNLTAQSNKEDIDLIQSAFGKDKKVLVSEYMHIAAKDSVAFWKLYDEYETKRKEVGKARINLIQQYADQYGTMTDAQATKLAQGSINNDMQYSKLYEVYYAKFSLILGGKNAAKLFQLESYLQNLVRLAVMSNIPFIGELDKEKAASATHH